MKSKQYTHIGGKLGDEEMISFACDLGFQGQSFTNSEGQQTCGAWSAYHFLRNQKFEIVDEDGFSLDWNYSFA